MSQQSPLTKTSPSVPKPTYCCAPVTLHGDPRSLKRLLALPVKPEPPLEAGLPRR